MATVLEPMVSTCKEGRGRVGFRATTALRGPSAEAPDRQSPRKLMGTSQKNWLDSEMECCRGNDKAGLKAIAGPDRT